MQKTEHDEREAYRTTEDFRRAITEDSVDTIISKALAAFPDKPKLSKHKRVIGISENRKEEIEAEYRSSIHSAGTQDSNMAEEETSDSDLDMSPIQRMLDQVLDELY